MNIDQINRIRAILVDRGLIFRPLQEDMIDHIGCDVEQLMETGTSFEQALHQTIGQIPAEHFTAIQRDALLAIDRRFRASNWLAGLTIATLLVALIFKVLHLQFSDELLILSLVLITGALLRGSFSGVSLVGKKNGTARAMLALAGVVLLQFGYAFKILRLPGAEIIIVAAVTLTVTALLSNTYAVFRHRPGKDTMLSFLHEKYTSNIERFLLILLSVMITAKIISITTNFTIPGAPIILLVIIFGAGLQFIALSWRILEQQVLFKRTVFLVGIGITSFCLVLPFLGEIVPWEIRVISVTLFTLASAWIAFRMKQHSANVFSSMMVVIVPILFIIWATLKSQLLPAEFYKYIFNLPVLGLLTAGILFSKKHDTIKSYMIISLGGYLIEYSS